MPRYDPAKHRRRSMRLQGYDYAQEGAYYVTVCAQDRVCLFGDVDEGAVRLSAIGQIVAAEWSRSPEIRREIELDLWVIMPNHLHGIVIIMGDDDHRRGDRPVAPTDTTTIDGRPKGPRPKSLSSLMAGFKSATTKRINILRDSPGEKVWQRGFYDHVIRDEADFNRIREYILNNPARWAEDRENPLFQTS